jgi:hypothetical protein
MLLPCGEKQFLLPPESIKMLPQPALSAQTEVRLLMRDRSRLRPLVQETEAASEQPFVHMLSEKHPFVHGTSRFSHMYLRKSAQYFNLKEYFSNLCCKCLYQDGLMLDNHDMSGFIFGRHT